MNCSTFLSGLVLAIVLCCCDASLYAAGGDVDEAIRNVRMGTLIVEAQPGVEVRVKQLRHEFWFGAALASQMFGGRANAEEAAQYKKVFLENFNAAVTITTAADTWTTANLTRSPSIASPAPFAAPSATPPWPPTCASATLTRWTRCSRRR